MSSTTRITGWKFSYHWLGGTFVHDSYGPEIAKKYPDLKYTAPHKDPLYALVTLDRKRGFLLVEGVKSEFVGPSPWELGASREKVDDSTLTSNLSAWKMPI